MRTRKAATLGAAVLLTATLLIASNMAFKLLVGFFGPVPNATPTGFSSGTNSLSLPFNRQEGLDKASDLFSDIDGGSGKVVQIARFVSSTDSVEFYTGTSGTDFSLTSGEGYLVQVNTDMTYLMVGTHDPTLAIQFLGPRPLPGGGQSAGRNLYANPIHSVASTAEELLNEIGAGVVTGIGRWVTSADTVSTYSGMLGDVDFSLTPGESYFVDVNTDVSFVPAHY